MPCRESKLRLSAAETLYFALCSVELFADYIDRTKECRFWDSWVKQIEFVRILVQPTITISELLKASALIEEHQKLFAEVRVRVLPCVTHPVTHAVTCPVTHPMLHTLFHAPLHTPLQVPEYQAKMGDATKDKYQ